MKCHNCTSPNVKSNRKYVAGTNLNRSKYEGMNVDRRRYICYDCGRPFYTIEVPEPLFEQNYYDETTNLATKARVR